ncbi:MAG: SAM-dependent methyltransferase [Defluviitaleaceae bacterium]|nr:SAM-dependent methyltransferase [Defluviitaleaceae bacterium]MCL2835505.1 SAM-dependent methyltransferase [Defluviitaleaceae bacterium]
MDNGLEKSLNGIAAAAPEKLVLSGPEKGAAFRRVNIRLGKQGYQVEKLTETQAFHERIGEGKLAAYLSGLFGMGFRQLHAWDADGREYAVRVAKSGKVISNKRNAGVKPVERTEHDRDKRYIISEGADVPAFRDMGIFTASGKVAANMYDKFKQINRFLEIIDDVYKSGVPNPVRVADFGCGKSYLTFLVYYYFTVIKGVSAEIVGLDLKEDVIKSCRETAERYGYTGLSFKRGNIAEYDNFQADLLISLHACDTATDYALFNAVKNNARVILVSPCCQHELNGQMRAENLGLFTRYGLLKERAAAVLTDAIRANLLTYAGYKVQILEFVDLSHTPKNVLIRAVKANLPRENRQAAYEEAMAAIKEFNLDPAFLRLLNDMKF